MSSNSTTLDFTTAHTERPHGLLSTIAAFWDSVRIGLAASHQYDDLTARGKSPQAAVDIVYRTHFSKIGK
ncbi:hypothetical protein ACO2I3_09090 [Leptospira interrogans]